MLRREDLGEVGLGSKCRLLPRLKILRDAGTVALGATKKGTIDPVVRGSDNLQIDFILSLMLYICTSKSQHVDLSAPLDEYEMKGDGKENNKS